MKNNKEVKIKYDPEADVLSWEISKTAKIDYASEMGDVVIHFSKNNLPVLVEILRASNLVAKSEKTIEKARELAFAH